MLLAVGCGKELNPEYCATHPDDTDCYGAGLSTVDAPLGCKTTHVCDSEPINKVCEVDTGSCVQCVPDVDVTRVHGQHERVRRRSDVSRLSRRHALHGVERVPAERRLREHGRRPLRRAARHRATARRRRRASSPMRSAMISPTKKIIKMTTAAGTDYTDPPLTIDKAACS